MALTFVLHFNQNSSRCKLFDAFQSVNWFQDVLQIMICISVIFLLTMLFWRSEKIGRLEGDYSFWPSLDQYLVKFMKSMQTNYWMNNDLLCFGNESCVDSVQGCIQWLVSVREGGNHEVRTCRKTLVLRKSSETFGPEIKEQVWEMINQVMDTIPFGCQGQDILCSWRHTYFSHDFQGTQPHLFNNLPDPDIERPAWEILENDS